MDFVKAKFRNGTWGFWRDPASSSMEHERWGVVLGAEIFTCTASDLVWNMYELCKPASDTSDVPAPWSLDTRPRSNQGKHTKS
jgi:hypothetical protein